MKRGDEEALYRSCVWKAEYFFCIVSQFRDSLITKLFIPVTDERYFIVFAQKAQPCKRALRAAAKGRSRDEFIDH